MYSPYLGTDLYVDISGDFVISTLISMVKTIYMQAVTESGASSPFLKVEVEICGLETIIVSDPIFLNYFYERNSGTSNICVEPASSYESHF